MKHVSFESTGVFQAWDGDFLSFRLQAQRSTCLAHNYILTGSDFH